MKLFIATLALALSACASVTSPTPDAAPINDGTVKSAFGATVTGRDWNANPSDARSSASDESESK